MTQLEKSKMLEEAINNNPNLDEVYKKVYLENLKVLDLCSSNLDFKKLYFILSNTDVIDLEYNVVYNSYDYETVHLAFQYFLDNNIYDLVNAYKHDALDLCNVIRFHEATHNLVDSHYYLVNMSFLVILLSPIKVKEFFVSYLE